MFCKNYLIKVNIEFSNGTFLSDLVENNRVTIKEEKLFNVIQEIEANIINTQKIIPDTTLKSNEYNVGDVNNDLISLLNHFATNLKENNY